MGIEVEEGLVFFQEKPWKNGAPFFVKKRRRENVGNG